MASELNFQYRQNNINNDGIVAETLSDISGKVCKGENFGVTSNTVEEKQFTIISNSTKAPCENMVPLAVKPVAVGDKTSAEVRITDDGMIVKNGVVANKVSEAICPALNKEECIVGADNNCIKRCDPKITQLHNDLVNAEQMSGAHGRNNLVTNNLVCNNLVSKDLISNNLVTNNQLRNEQCISAKQSAPNNCPSVRINEQYLTDGRTILPDDLLYVLSVVEEDMKGMGISTVNDSTKGRQLLTNVNKVIDSEDLDEEVSTDESDSSEDSSSSSSESSDESDPESKEDAIIKRAEMARDEHFFLQEPPKTKNEISISDLPNLQPIDIFADDSVKLSPMGEIERIMLQDAIVIIKSFENVPALDSDTILFLEDRTGFGSIFEIFGQVRNPHYCIRFNNQEEIKSTNVKIGQSIFFAPDTKDLTTFVFVSKLKSIKGTDASWKDDLEPPSAILEFSDDEAESHAKSAKKRANKLKKRNEAHMQEQMQGETEAATSKKKERPLTPPTKHPQTIPSPRPQQGQQLPYPQHQQQSPRLPPKLHVPPQFTPRGNQHQPFHHPPRGPPHPPWFTGEPSQRRPPTNYITSHGPLPPGHPRQHFGPPNPGVPPYHPPPQPQANLGVGLHTKLPPPPNWNGPPPPPNWDGSPPQPNWDGLPPRPNWDGPPPRPNWNSPPPRPNWDGPPPRPNWNGPPPRPNWDAPPPRPNWDGPPPRPNWDGPPVLGPQPWENAFPIRPPVNQQWPCQPQLPAGQPYIKQQSLQNTQMPQSQNWGEPPENVKAYLNT